MIDRYTLPEIGQVWSEAHKYELWCRVERLVLEAHAADGVVPADAVEPVRDAPAPAPFPRTASGRCALPRPPRPRPWPR